MNTNPSSPWKSFFQIYVLGVLIFILASVTSGWNGASQEVQRKPSSKELRLENSTKAEIIEWISLKMNEERSSPLLSNFSMAPAIESPKKMIQAGMTMACNN